MRILLFVDPTPHGDWAIGLARDLVRGLSSTSLILLTTRDIANSHPGILDRAETHFREFPGVVIEKSIRDARPRVAIIEETRASLPAITIVPPAGRKWLARVLHGSRVRTVVDGAASTIMVARQPVAEHIHRILVTVSGGPMSQATSLGALEVARALQAGLTLLYVSSTVPIPSDDDAGEALPEGIEAARALLEGSGVEFAFKMREGMVVPEVIAECREGKHDLLILGQHVITPEAGGDLAQNIARDLVMECPIPTLVIRGRQQRATAAGS